LEKNLPNALAGVRQEGMWRDFGFLSLSHRFHAPDPPSNGHHPRLRDQLCLLIRQHNLDPALVKAYAADFCGTQTLKDASRDLVDKMELLSQTTEHLNLFCGDQPLSTGDSDVMQNQFVQPGVLPGTFGHLFVHARPHR
jgi:hypothetical protein